MADRPINPSGVYGKDVRNLSSGKDAAIYDGAGKLLATVDSFQAQVEFATADYQPLGSPIRQAFLTGYAVTINISNCVVESEDFVRQAADFFIMGRHAPTWDLQGTITRADGAEERIIYRDCVPAGQMDLANYQVGDIVKRTLVLRCNVAPELQRTM